MEGLIFGILRYVYPHPSFASSQNNFTLTPDPQDATTLDFVPSQRNKRRIVDGLSSWLEALNVFLRSVLSLYPRLPQDLLAYQPQICKFSRKFKESSWIMSDTVFHYMAASNVSMAWGKVNEQLYNDILRPSPTASITTPMAIVLWPPHPFNFGPSTAFSATSFSNTYGSPSTAPNLPSRPEHPLIITSISSTNCTF